MAERKFVYRLVVDKWPTADGQPFVDQDWQWWQSIVDYFHNPEGDDQNPDWLPDLESYLEYPGAAEVPPSWHPPAFTRIIVEPGEPFEYETGYSGFPDRRIIAVPVAPTRRFLQRSTPLGIAKQLREWGCTAHVERSELGAWEAINA